MIGLYRRLPPLPLAGFKNISVNSFTWFPMAFWLLILSIVYYDHCCAEAGAWVDLFVLALSWDIHTEDWHMPEIRMSISYWTHTFSACLWQWGYSCCYATSSSILSQSADTKAGLKLLLESSSWETCVCLGGGGGGASGTWTLLLPISSDPPLSAESPGVVGQPSETRKNNEINDMITDSA